MTTPIIRPSPSRRTMARCTAGLGILLLLAATGARAQNAPLAATSGSPLTRAESALLSDLMTMTATNLTAALERLTAAESKAHSAAFDFAAGNLYMQAGQTDGAIAAYRRALTKAPDDGDTWYNLGRAYLVGGQPVAAADAFQHRLRRGGRESATLILLGQALLLDSQPLHAETAFREAILLDSTPIEAHRGLVQSLLGQQRHAEATTALAPLLRRHPTAADLWALSANLHLAQDDSHGAIVAIETARRLKAVTPETLALLGDLYLNTADPDSALGAYREAYATTEPSPERLLRIAEGWLMSGHGEQAAEWLKRAAPKAGAPDATPALHQRYQRLLADTAHRRGDIAGAATLYEALLREDPLNGHALLRLGELASQSGDPARARLQFERAMRLPATRYQATVAMAQVEVAAENYAAAVTLIEQALSLNDTPALRHYLDQLRPLTTR